MKETPAHGLTIPPESALLKAAYKSSGLRAADIAAAAGLSVGSVHIALNGIRYRHGEAKIAVPSDASLIKLASVLRVSPDALREADRARAAALLEQAQREQGEMPATFASDQEAQAALAGRAALAKQVLAAFSSEELRAELERRDREPDGRRQAAKEAK